MRLEALRQQLEQRLNAGLPGEELQYAMAPLGRRKLARIGRPDAPKRAGVLILIYPNPQEAYLVLTQRHPYKGVHGGQVSLPGGRMEPEDSDLLATALREASEEVNIDPGCVEVLGQLTELYIPPSNFLILPVVAMATTRPDFKREEKEVKEILEVPLCALLHADAVKSAEMRISAGMTVDVPYFDLLGRQVWGATAMVLSELKALITS